MYGHITTARGKSKRYEDTQATVEGQGIAGTVGKVADSRKGAEGAPGADVARIAGGSDMRSATAWIWGRSALFRWLVLRGGQQTWCPSLARWCCVGTPLFIELRELMLAQGHYDLAAEFTRRLREAGEL
jgi:hypothetical protein